MGLDTAVRAFVTGGTGFLGRHLIDHLLAQGDEVVSLVRTLDRARTLPGGARTVAGDLTRPAALRAAMRGADVVYHAAALHRLGLRPRDYERLERINVAGTRAVLALAGELGVPRVVFTSCLAVFGHTAGRLVDETALPGAPPPTSAYAQAKWRAHTQAALPLLAQGLPLTIVCPGALYGPGDTGDLGRVLRRYALRRLPVMLGPDTAFSWTFAADAAAGHRLAATRGMPGQTYLLAGPAQTWREFFAAAQQATGLPAPRLWVPSGLARVLARALHQVQPGLAERWRAFSGQTFLGRADKAQRELGWQARAVAAGLPETVAWYVEQDRQAKAAARRRTVSES
jgi:dihydroflavonol-4-reductase